MRNRAEIKQLKQFRPGDEQPSPVQAERAKTATNVIQNLMQVAGTVITSRPGHNWVADEPVTGG